MAVVLGLLTALSRYKGSGFTLVLLVLAVGFLLCGLLRPILLKKFYIGWMTIAFTLGFFMTKVILSILFYVVFTIGGIIGRLINNDMLDQNYNHDTPTYWKPHKKPQDVKQHLERQF